MQVLFWGGYRCFIMSYRPKRAVLHPKLIHEEVYSIHDGTILI